MKKIKIALFLCPACDPPGCGSECRGGRCSTCDGRGTLTEEAFDKYASKISPPPAKVEV